MNFVKQQQPTKIISQQKTKPHVHLEPITRKADRGVGISNLRKSLEYRAGEVNLAQQPQINRTITSTLFYWLMCGIIEIREKMKPNELISTGKRLLWIIAPRTQVI